MTTTATATATPFNRASFGGISADFDPGWLLTPAQQALQESLIALCSEVLRPNAIASDRNLIYPRKNFEALASLGLLGLL
ncbi:MAG: acyl-CoA dehydrogenase, partial [Cyanobacteria bacterium J06614_10]